MCDDIKNNPDYWDDAKPLIEKAIKKLYENTDQESQELAQDLEMTLDPVYCPRCGSCGEDLCCDPTKCESVQAKYGGLYCEHNIKQYDEILEKNFQLEKENKELKNRMKK